MGKQPRGWYPDPENPLRERLWDGDDWVERVRPRPPATAAETPAASTDVRDRRSTTEEDAVAGPRVVARRFFVWSGVLIAGALFIGISALVTVNDSRDARPRFESTSSTVAPQVAAAALEREQACPKVLAVVGLAEQWLKADHGNKQLLVSLGQSMRSQSIYISNILRDDEEYGPDNTAAGTNLDIARTVKSMVDSIENYSKMLLDEPAPSSRRQTLEGWSNTHGEVLRRRSDLFPLLLVTLETVERSAETMSAMCGWKIVKPNPGDYGYENERWKLEPIGNLEDLLVYLDSIS
jgi:hypothetical protein